VTAVTQLAARADQAYLAREWEAALSLQRALGDTHPQVAAELHFALTEAHCAIELADADALTALAPDAGPPTSSPRETQLVGLIRGRVHECCRAGDLLRASALLRLIAPLDPSIAGAYAHGLLTRRSDPQPDDPSPRFLTDCRVADWSIDAAKRRHRDKRLLLVRRYGFRDNPARQHEGNDNLARTATSFGLRVHEIDSFAAPGPDADRYADTLRNTIDGFRPDLVFYDELFLSGASALPGPAAAIGDVLATARRTSGVRVVKSYTDGWYVVAHGPDSLFAQLGRCYDVVHHCHPGMLDHGSAAERASVFCYPFPTVWPTPTAEAADVPRAGFVGGIHPGSIARLVWWAETVRAGLPLDFIEARHDAVEQRSDLDYINLLRRYAMSVNFTLRPTGARILTARTLEVPLAGGVLVEEDNQDTRYFLRAGIDFVPFETVPDLAALLPALLADEPRRRALAKSAHDWVTRYFTGDYFWTGLLDRLYG
jgi:hypothetical protein